MTSVISRITLAAVCLSTMLGASEKPTTVLAKHLYANTQNHTVLHDKDGFSVNGKRVSDADVSKDLRGISGGSLRKLFAKDKALHVERLGSGYKINSRERLNGGGPISGWIAYWVTKSVCYGGIGGAAVAGAATVATIAAPAAATAVAANLAGAGAGLAVASVIPGTATAGATLVGSVVVANAAVATGAAIATAELATTAAAAGGLVAAVETTSTGIGLFFASLPFLP